MGFPLGQEPVDDPIQMADLLIEDLVGEPADVLAEELDVVVYGPVGEVVGVSVPRPDRFDRRRACRRRS